MKGQDEAFMRKALDLAAQGLGRVAPNPSVGCLIVKDGEILGAARSADGGRPHAEPQALSQAGAGAKGATAYITLEPCGHFGKTPPCVDALIAAGVVRAVIACRDPNQKGYHCIERLEEAGIAVTLGICEQEARLLNEGFFRVIETGRPLVTAKIATSLDGRIATCTGHSQWITGEQARQKVHEFRATHDAVLVGVGTVLADDPQLTVRLPGSDAAPRRVIIDHDLKTPPQSRLFGGGGPIWLLHGPEADPVRQSRLRDRGARLIALESAGRHFDPESLLKALAGQEITRLFIEGGGRTLTGFVKAGLVDRLLWFRAPKLIGGDGIPALESLGVQTMEDAPCFDLQERMALGDDVLEIWSIPFCCNSPASPL